MAQAPVAPPVLYKTTRPSALQISAQSDGTNTFAALQFVKLVNGNLTNCVIGETTAVVGLALDPSHAATDEPYTQPFGEQHNVLGLQEATFIVNTATTAKGIGTGTSSALTIGALYGITTFADAGYTNVQAMDVSNTTATFFRLQGFYPNDSTADTNARVVVSVVSQATSV